MATTVAQHPVTAFTSPTNGTSPIDADEVVANDQSIRAAYNAHDADTGIHVQSSVFGSRPAAGTSGRKYITVDQLSAPTQVRSFYDDGTNWYEHNYFGSATTVAAALTVTTGGIAVTGASSIAGITTVTGLESAYNLKVKGEATSSTIRFRTQPTATGATIQAVNNAEDTQVPLLYNALAHTLTASAGNITLTPTGGAVVVSTGGITVTGNSTITGTLGGLTGLTVASGGAAIGGGATITGSAIVTADLTVDTDTLKVDSANNRVGVGTASPSTAFHVVGASTLAGTVTVSAGSTTNALTVTTTGAIQGSFRYDGSNRLDVSVSSAGAVTFDAVGGSAAFTFSDPVRVNAAGGLALAVSDTTQLLVMPNDGGSSAAGKTIEYRTDGTAGNLRAHTFLVNNGNFAGEFAASTTAEDTFLLVYDYTGASMKRVVRGAADSGGTGFRMLRIAN